VYVCACVSVCVNVILLLYVQYTHTFSDKLTIKLYADVLNKYHLLTLHSVCVCVCVLCVCVRVRACVGV